MAKSLSMTKRVEIIDQKEFAKVAPNENIEVFVIYVAFFSLRQITIHLTWEA